MFVKISPPARPSRGASRPFSVECCPLRLAALGQPSQACKCPRGGKWSELSQKKSLSLVTSGDHQQSFSAAAASWSGDGWCVRPDPRSKALTTLSLSHAWLLVISNLRSFWVDRLPTARTRAVAAALTHWALTRGLWQQFHWWRPGPATHQPPILPSWSAHQSNPPKKMGCY